MATKFDVTIFGISDYRFPKDDEFLGKFAHIKRLEKTLPKLTLIDCLHFLCVKRHVNVGFLLFLCFLGILLLPVFILLYLIKVLAGLNNVIYFKLRNIPCLRRIVLKSRNIQILLQYSFIPWRMMKFYRKKLLNSCRFFIKFQLHHLLLVFSKFRNVFMVTAVQLKALYTKVPKLDIVYSYDLESLLTGAIYKFKKGCILVYNFDELWLGSCTKELIRNTYFNKLMNNLIKNSVDIIIVVDQKTSR